MLAAPLNMGVKSALDEATVGDLLNDAAKIAVVAVVATTALSIRLREAAGLGRDVAIAGIATSLAVGVVALGLLIILI